MRHIYGLKRNHVSAMLGRGSSGRFVLQHVNRPIIEIKPAINPAIHVPIAGSVKHH